MVLGAGWPGRRFLLAGTVTSTRSPSRAMALAACQSYLRGLHACDRVEILKVSPRQPPVLLAIPCYPFVYPAPAPLLGSVLKARGLPAHLDETSLGPFSRGKYTLKPPLGGSTLRPLLCFPEGVIYLRPLLVDPAFLVLTSNLARTSESPV